MHRYALFTIMFALLFNHMSFASNIDLSSVNRLDLKKGKIVGRKAPYTLILPSLWSGYLIGEYEQNNDSKGLVEKINFYYEPLDKLTKPVYFLSFHVYDNKYWRESGKMRKLKETEDHVFAVSCAEDNPLKGVTDMRLFDTLLTNAKNDDLLKRMISLPDGVKVITRNTVSVNDKAIAPKTVLGSDGVLYLPLRATCESLGYLVGWEAKDNLVLLIKGDFSYYLSTKKLNKNYKILVADGSTYVSSYFFIKVLGLNVEIDKNNNAFITT